jgi:hypothetical protein
MMRYWWVSNKQTYLHEFTGGYMWSPKLKSNGHRNQHWDFMTEVEPLDIIFAYAKGRIRAVGVATSSAYTSDKPRSFGTIGEHWSATGWRVDVVFRKLESPIAPKDYWNHIQPLLPPKYSPLTAVGGGKEAYLSSIGEKLGSFLLTVTQADIPEVETARLEDLQFDLEEQEIALDVALPETMRVTLIKARRGQGVFRERVQTIETKCRVTGVKASELLIASHIKPWRGSDPDERLNGNNGLFLSPHIDKLFDKGLISFEKNGSMLVSPSLDQEVLAKWSIDPKRRYGTFNSEQAYFLDHHNEVVFESSAA